MKRHSSDHPFFKGRYLNHPMYALDVVSRLDMVKTFDIAKCGNALRVKGLQATVRKAIERRLKSLRNATEEEAS